ncbi:YetF domain-containing protein [Frigidibacter sp. SD6-1]|uniref:DUF421 domain-containing protein n=1 Tax=Frigidibacter sp. SD6-1 TaxID=3032581 RepID=UPI0024DFB528|nr:YetF domain-containing protein [Frigidibacter sp. SD6-1]
MPYLFDGFAGILRTIGVGALAYLLLILFLRVSGKRTLSKMNAFDLVVTVALGSTLATVLLSRDVALAEGAAAFATLIGGQYIITWLSVRSRSVRRLVKSEPALLVSRGAFLDAAMMRSRVTQAEIHAAMRAEGIAALQDVGAVLLETDGSFTVLAARNTPEGFAGRFASRRTGPVPGAEDGGT